MKEGTKNVASVCLCMWNDYVLFIIFVSKFRYTYTIWMMKEKEYRQRIGDGGRKKLYPKMLSLKTV